MYGLNIFQHIKLIQEYSEKNKEIHFLFYK